MSRAFYDRRPPWLRCVEPMLPDPGVGSPEYRMARTLARIAYVPPVLPTEIQPFLNRLEFHGRNVYFSFVGKCQMLTPPVCPTWEIDL